MLDKIRTILIHNSHPGNIGAAARALKNMGLKKLTLVAPKEFPSIVATQRAGRASDILENAVVVPTLKEALIGCRLIYGTSQRARSLAWPVLTGREAAEQIFSCQNEKEDIAILYGCEKFGLSNEELHYCQAQIIIEAHPEYASLNLAQAVQIISYEIWLANLANTNRMKDVSNSSLSTPDCATTVSLSSSGVTDNSFSNFDEMLRFYQHLEQTLVDIHFLDPKQPKHLMSRIKRLFDKAQLDKTELNILRGILTAVQKNV